MDTVALEKAEQQIDQFIAKRERERVDADKVEELWAEQERRHRERRREQNREAWRVHHAHMQALHAGLSEEHKAKADALGEQEIKAISQKKGGVRVPPPPRHST